MRRRVSDLIALFMSLLRVRSSCRPAITLALFTSVALSGCSTLGLNDLMGGSSNAEKGIIEAPSTLEPIRQGRTIEGLLISYNRSTIGRTDFEQYRVAGNKLIWECGRISAGRYNPSAQGVATVAEQTLQVIDAASAKIYRLVTEKGAKFQQPGTTPEFFDPGQYSLTLDHPTAPVTIKTTFDSVATPNATREQLLNKLTIAVRSAVVNETPCGIKEFYNLAAPRGF